MKKAVFLIILIIILSLDWAALDDITTGKEPDFFWEYATFFLSIPSILILSWSFWKRKNSS